MCKNSQQKTVQSNKLDPAQMQLFMQNYGQAQDVANTPYQGYDPNARVAAFTPETLAAQGSLTNFGNGNTGQPTLNTAINTASGVAGYNPGSLATTDLSPYMNPYQGDVIDQTLAELGRARDAGIMSNGQRATQENAFGGDRQAVLDSLTNKDYLNTAASTLANLNSQNFTNAQNAATGDLNRNLSTAGLNLSGAGALAGMSDQQIQDALQRAGALGQVGNQSQTQAQNLSDAAYQEFMRRIAYPEQQQELRNQSLSLIPLQETTTGTQSYTPGLLDYITSFGSLLQGGGSAASGLGLGKSGAAAAAAVPP